MLRIPISVSPSQILKCVLNNQNTQISIYQKNQGVFVDVAISGELLASAVIARDATPLVCRDYAGFNGNIMFVDTAGNNDPDYKGFGSRFELIYLNGDEYALF